MTPTPAQIRAAAEAIANARDRRQGMWPVSNILDVLSDRQVVEVMEEAEAALKAAEEVREKEQAGGK
jgi:hypothetical protein